MKLVGAYGCFIIIIIYFLFARGGWVPAVDPEILARLCEQAYTVFRCFARHLFCVTWQGFRERE
jgi:hypothetical protein